MQLETVNMNLEWILILLQIVVSAKLITLIKIIQLKKKVDGGNGKTTKKILKLESLRQTNAFAV
jgi:hypothetical protein